MPRRKTTGAAGKPAADTRPIHQRGQTWQAVKLTGNRAQRGNLPGGAPRFVYEVLWQGGAKTYEPADCLVSWGKEMKAVDEACGVRALMPQINPAAEARRARELAAKKKAEELEKRRADLQRQQRRRARCARLGDALEDDEDEADHLSDVSDASDAMEDDHDASEEQLAEELRVLEEQLQRLAGGAVFEAAAGEAAAGHNAVDSAALGATIGKANVPLPKKQARVRQCRSLVWKAFDRKTDRCTLFDSGRGCVCDSPPDSGTGTSGHIRHLERQHPEDWLSIKRRGEPTTRTQRAIDDAMAAVKDKSMPRIDESGKHALDRLVARWIAKCGRPQCIAEDKELQEVLSRMLELCKARLRYELPCETTVRRQLQLLGAEGKAIARDFLVRCLASGVKISITGDLWSENGMGLFGSLRMECLLSRWKISHRTCGV